MRISCSLPRSQESKMVATISDELSKKIADQSAQIEIISQRLIWALRGFGDRLHRFVSARSSMHATRACILTVRCCALAEEQVRCCEHAGGHCKHSLQSSLAYGPYLD